MSFITENRAETIAGFRKWQAEEARQLEQACGASYSWKEADVVKLEANDRQFDYEIASLEAEAKL